MKIALDSNCLTYLINACEGRSNVDPLIKEEGLALIRIWSYLIPDERYFISKQVTDECREIGNKDVRETHLAFANPYYFGFESKAPDIIEARAKQFFSTYPREKDCRVLAEAEDMGVNILLSYDGPFISKLGQSSNKVRIMRPSEYWQSVQLPRGSKPNILPGEGNPLASNTFWLW